ncbi:MarR family transcriptional regulator [Bacillus sp. WMMC1349]|uniref:bifunctional helix-turn-helix transcriptional regulator/GNAT family N-acetyltransferase n=1 Tax=Bacillus sp. WMMC1349 TaxID=2736254 RepID=UPI00155654A0|nr:helix-turn-helix domain-containing GNAT family N-acetyltransferase [Bacillus sp. WMMC1349]NPC91509.1 MarR family transcriptional regulator [Bacillus sp. WMMC1349]
MEPNQSTLLKFRKFNRFYTNVLGFLNEHIYDSPFSLTETRILFEIHHTGECTAKMIQDKLGLDRGYVSRLIKHFEKEKIIYRKKSEEDSRHHYIYLTEFGQTIYKKLEAKANQQIDYILKQIDDQTQKKLVEAMNTVECILSEHLSPKNAEISIRDYYISDDIKLMIEKQRTFYAETHGWDHTFTDYLHETFHAKIEKIWIAESAGRFAGCIGLVKLDDHTAQLRWFLVDPAFHRKGIGTRLIQQLVNYCQSMNFKQIILWTVKTMKEARPLYEKFGFKQTEIKEATLLWGQVLQEERWDLTLA